MNTENIKTIAKINNHEISIIKNGETFVPIKPICEALGVDFKSQTDKIRNDKILSSTIALSTIIAADGKQRKMFTLPLKYIFGWLFTINPKNVKPEAKENVIKYKIACYDALYSHFTEKNKFLEEKQTLINTELEAYQTIQEEFKTAKKRLAEHKNRLNEVRLLSFEEWKQKNSQLKLF